MQILPLLLTGGSPPIVAQARGIPFFLFRTGAFASSFPTQFASLRVYDGGVVELSLVALADAPSGMGGQLRISKGGTTYAVYLVETSDPDASNVRIQTTTGIKAIRRLT